jgi:hypothetical protein
MNAEEFLASRTGRCERLHMRITPENCRKLREQRPDFRNGIEGPPPQCAGCPGVMMDGAKESKMQQQFYTIKELATLLGEKVGDVRNAKTWTPKNPRPGSAIYRIIEAMKDRGITWDQVVSSISHENKADSPAPTAAPASVPAPAPADESPPAVAPEDPGDYICSAWAPGPEGEAATEPERNCETCAHDGDGIMDCDECAESDFCHYTPAAHAEPTATMEDHIADASNMIDELPPEPAATMEVESVMKNKLSDLNDHLFAQLERLSDEDLKGEKLRDEIERAQAVTNVAGVIIANGSLVLKALVAMDHSVSGAKLPPMLEM